MASSASKRYTQALVEIAQETNTYEAWQRDLETLAALAAESSVKTFLENPGIPTEHKISAVASAAATLQPAAQTLLRMLIQRRRISLLPDIVSLFTERAMEARGIVLVDVTTADALDDAGVELVRERLKRIVGKDVELRLHHDASLIGGIVARIGDQVIDGSVASQLRRLRARLNAV